MLGNLLKIVPVMKLNYDLVEKIDTLDKVRTVKKVNLRLLIIWLMNVKLNNKDFLFLLLNMF